MKRLKTLCIILLVVFFASLFQSIVTPFIEGVKYGLAIAKYENDNQMKTDDFPMMDIVPKNNNFMENDERNTKTGEQLLIRPNNISILAHALPDKPFWWNTSQAIYAIIILTVIGLTIWIPFLVISILRSLQNSQVFERKNLKYINRIGIIILSLGIMDTIIQSLNIFMAQSLIDLGNYEFTYSKVVDFNAIIMGIIILIMNEVLKRAIEMKEEQDLTI